MEIPRLTPVLLLAAMAASCWQRREPAAAPFTVARVSPELGDAAAPLLLNDAITVYFSAPVDPISVTRDTISVLDSEGNLVPGRLRIGGSWVTFEPRPPLTASLEDGSLRPGRDYRLVVGGYPRIDSVRAADGRRLASGAMHTFRTASRDTASATLPAPLRPIADGTLPFLVQAPGAELTLPADNPRLRLRFSLPLLPSSLTPAAFDVKLVRPSSIGRTPPQQLQLREARIVGIDELHGCTVELDLGLRPQVRGGASVQLQPGDVVYLTIVKGDGSLRDYADRELLAPPAPFVWSVVEGAAAIVAQWPHGDDRWLFTGDLAAPGFEVAAGALRPLVRVEAGDGSLGVFRPQVDTRLVPGAAFDRGDGTQVASRGTTFPFQAIDVPAGVTVTVDARNAPVQLLALGRARIAGRIVVEGGSGSAALPPGWIGDVRTILDTAAVSVLAAGGIEIRAGAGNAPSGVEVVPPGAGVPLALVSAGAITVHAPVPFAILASERELFASESRVERCVTVQVRLTPGLPNGAEAVAQGLTSFRPLPPTIGAPSMRLGNGDAAIHVDWQSAPADLSHPERPDVDPTRISALRELVEGQPLAAPTGSFLRLRLEARVHGGEPLPQLTGVAVLDR